MKNYDKFTGKAYSQKDNRWNEDTGDSGGIGCGGWLIVLVGLAIAVYVLVLPTIAASLEYAAK